MCYSILALSEMHEKPEDAGVAELVDARDLKSCGTQIPCRFDPGLRHHIAG